MCAKCRSLGTAHQSEDETIDNPTLFAALLNDGVRYVHLLAVAIGMGASFFADQMVLRRLRNPVSDGLLETLHQCHRIVWIALLGMWISGITLVYLRTGFVWENVSPKLINKGVVVTVLTLNAWAIGRVAMGHIHGSLGKSVLDLPMRVKLPLALISGVSTTSWLLALALGSSKVLAQSSADILVPLTLAAYAACTVLSLGSAIFLKTTATAPQGALSSAK